jgi:hypothetical protein
MKTDTSSVVQEAEAAEVEFARLRAACLYPYSRIEHKGTGEA